MEISSGGTSVDGVTLQLNSSGQAEVKDGGETLTAVQKLRRENAKQAVKILLLEADGSVTSSDYDDIHAEVFQDSNGYNNYVNTGNTTATWQDADIGYNNEISGSSYVTYEDHNDNSVDSNKVICSGTPNSFSELNSANLHFVYAGDNASGGEHKVAYKENVKNRDVKLTFYASGSVTFSGSATAKIVLSTSTSYGTGDTDIININGNFTASDNVELIWNTDTEVEVYKNGTSTGTTITGLSADTYYFCIVTSASGTDSATIDIDQLDIKPSPTYGDKIVELDFPSTGTNITDMMVVAEGDTDNIDVDISADGGTNWDTAKTLDEKHTITNQGTTPKIKINLKGTSEVQCQGVAVVIWTS